MNSTCPVLKDPETQWSFCPSLGAASALVAFFALTTLTHLVQAIYHKKPYCWVIVASGTAQLFAYIFRVVSILQPTKFGPYAAWFVLILIAPLFTNAFVYMVMGRMVWNYIPNAKIYRVSAWRFGTLFVLLDGCALVIQIYGAATATERNIPESDVLKGLHIYMIGVGIQQAFILLFIFFAIKFHRIVLQQESQSESKANGWLPLLYTLYGVLILITIRIIFRLCEYAQGLTSNIPLHEVYQYCLDTLPMLLALIALNIWHPGRIMNGKESNIPGRKQRKGKNAFTKAEWTASSNSE